MAALHEQGFSALGALRDPAPAAPMLHQAALRSALCQGLPLLLLQGSNSRWQAWRHHCLRADMLCRCHIAMPDDAAREKAQLLEAYGAVVERVRPVSFSHPDHFVHRAKRAAASEDGAVFADQFENLANMHAHQVTADEIWQQTGGRLDAFVCGAGTGGTIAGVSTRLKQLERDVKACLLARVKMFSGHAVQL